MAAAGGGRSAHVDDVARVERRHDAGTGVDEQCAVVADPCCDAVHVAARQFDADLTPQRRTVRAGDVEDAGHGPRQDLAEAGEEGCGQLSGARGRRHQLLEPNTAGRNLLRRVGGTHQVQPDPDDHAGMGTVNTLRQDPGELALLAVRSGGKQVVRPFQRDVSA